jgi:hypothetical protein
VTERARWLIAAVESLPPRCGSVRVLAIDGGAAAGKSTLAAELAAAYSQPPSAPASLDALPRMNPFVLHTDDLIDGWDDQFGYWHRLRTGVLTPLGQGRSGGYQRYDWVTGSFAEFVVVPVGSMLIVEGVSAIAACGDALCLGALLRVPRAEREQRWRQRDGALSPTELRWLENEEPYLLSLSEASSPSDTASFSAAAATSASGGPTSERLVSASLLSDSATGLSLLRPPVRWSVPGQPS